MAGVQGHLRQTQMVGSETVEWLPPAPTLGSLRRRGIAAAGKSFTRPGYVFARPQPDLGTLIVTTAGEGAVLVGDSFVAALPGTLYWAPPGAPSAYHCPDDGGWQISWVTVQPGRLPLTGLGVRAICHAMPGPELAGYVDRYCEEALARADPAVLEPLAELLTVSLVRLCAPARRLDALWSHVDARLDHPWRLAELAARVGLSCEQLRAVCVAERGEPPLRHLSRRRLQRAATLLQATGDTIATIGRRVGYTDAFAFSTAFTRWAGCPPSAYRERALTGSPDRPNVRTP